MRAQESASPRSLFAARLCQFGSRRIRTRYCGFRETVLALGESSSQESRAALSIQDQSGSGIVAHGRTKWASGDLVGVIDIQRGTIGGNVLGVLSQKPTITEGF